MKTRTSRATLRCSRVPSAASDPHISSCIVGFCRTWTLSRFNQPCSLLPCSHLCLSGFLPLPWWEWPLKLCVSLSLPSLHLTMSAPVSTPPLRDGGQVRSQQVLPPSYNLLHLYEKHSILLWTFIFGLACWKWKSLFFVHFPSPTSLFLAVVPSFLQFSGSQTFYVFMIPFLSSPTSNKAQNLVIPSLNMHLAFLSTHQFQVQTFIISWLDKNFQLASQPCLSLPANYTYT